MTLSTRNLIILDFLVRKKESTVKEIANKFNISESSARYDLKHINYLLKTEMNKNLSFIGKGVVKYIDSDYKIINFENSNIQYILSSEERISFLELYILLGNYSLNLKKIYDVLNITRNTLKEDLKKVRSNFKKNDIIINLNEELISGVINDFDYALLPLSKIIRKYLFERELYLHLNKFIFDNIFKYVKYDKIPIILNYAKHVLKKSNIILSDESYQMLISYMIILIESASAKEFEIKFKKNESFFKNKNEFYILKSYKYILEDEFKLLINDDIISSFTNFLLGSQTYNQKFDLYEHWIKCEVFLKKFIGNVGEKLEIDFSKDIDLFNGLLNHMKPAMYRIKNNIKLENSIYEELITQDLELFNTIKKSFFETNELENISNDEIAYLVIYFKTSIDKIKQERLISVLIICNFGYGTSKLLAERLKEIYSIDIKGTIPMYELEKYANFKEIDFIISTSNIGVDSFNNIPVIKINPLLSSFDLNKLDNLNFKRNKKKLSLSALASSIKNEVSSKTMESIIIKLRNEFKDFLIDDYKLESEFQLKNILTEKRIMLVDNISWKDAIKALGNTLVFDGSVKQDYINDIIEVVKENGPYMVIDDYYGVFHAKNKADVFKTSLALLVSKKPIKIQEKHTNFILILASRDGYEHLNAILEFSKIFENKTLVNEIKNLNSEKEIYSLIFRK